MHEFHPGFDRAHAVPSACLLQIFLDGLGVPPASPRRSSHTGIQWRYSLNPGTPEAVDLFLLDERYERAPLPCEVRQQWCERADATGGGDTQRRAWCADFLNSGGQGERGSCCKADQAVFNAWCKEVGFIEGRPVQRWPGVSMLPAPWDPPEQPPCAALPPAGQQ